MGHLPLEPVTKKIENNNLPEWSSSKEERGGWVGGSKQKEKER